MSDWGGWLQLLQPSRFKSASPARQEQARLEVENAEDDLVQKTEVAITLMKTVLENVREEFVSFCWRFNDFPQPEPLKNLNELVKAELTFNATSAEALSLIQGDIEELSVAAEGEYRSVNRNNYKFGGYSSPKVRAGNLATIEQDYRQWPTMNPLF